MSLKPNRRSVTIWVTEVTMDDLTEVFGSKDLAEAYAKGLRAMGADFDFTVTVTEGVTGEWTVTAEYVAAGY